MKNGSRLLQILLQASEKAANVARACRQNEELFPLLIQEKSSEEKNPRFFHDFKTLADVLIQEIIKHDIGVEFPELPKSTKGEETNVFKNAANETIIVEVCPCCEDTAKLLARVMNDDVAARLLATEVHKDVQFSDVSTDVKEIPTDLEIDMNDIGIWIDPIDSTADYINAIETVDEKTGLHVRGLRCTCVLIGAYQKSTGVPIMGIVNQPFYTNVDSRWTGKCHWGIATSDITKSSISNPINLNANKLILISQSEDEEVRTKLLDEGFTLLEATGAGYKLLQVALGHAGIYSLSKPSTYKWDTCGPQAILASLGGDVIKFKEFIVRPTADDLTITYLSACTSNNKSGLIAYRDVENLESVKEALCKPCLDT
ncbi:hypothetical protein DMN91_010032 [Ooceraea biroi]|uniref:inositol-1,4-bisphosphate 1-phosphatase n=1 Tax=Ooceraea biroi TaxID=2015173 RepID=A0A026WVW2_OOCBI|nr:inositol polyphosphate 1-phosphatase [Ooceraea biroi]EZA60137.1 Inositol polyphosphate 1-phosphatase [Ooceraea biroi]RLU17794.1 hypothetical protein DMN91_010032 [Ooceraea biroi]